MDYFDTGFAVRKASWHGKEDILDEAPDNWADARKFAKLTWEPESRIEYITRYRKEFILCNVCTAKIGKLHDEDCTLDEAKGIGRSPVILEDCAPEGSMFATDGEHVFVPSDHQQILRNDSFALLTADVSEHFSLIYHGKDHAKKHDAYSMEQIIESYVPLGAKFDTTGAAKGGSLVWAVMYLDEPFKIPGDKSLTVPYMAITNCHDASGACKLLFTEVRIVCANTWQQADLLGDRTGNQLVFRHVGDVEGRIEEMQQSLNDLRETTKQFIAMASVMQEVHITEKMLGKYVSEFIPNPAENGEQVSERVQTNIDNSRAAFKHILEQSVTCEGIEDTMYGVVQASTEYLDHIRKYRSRDTYLGRTILKAEPLKARVLGIAGNEFSAPLKALTDPWADQLLALGEQEKAKSLAARAMLLR